MAQKAMRVMNLILISKSSNFFYFLFFLAKFMVKELKMVSTPARRMNSNSQNLFQ